MALADKRFVQSLGRTLALLVSFTAAAVSATDTTNTSSSSDIVTRLAHYLSVESEAFRLSHSSSAFYVEISPTVVTSTTVTTTNNCHLLSLPCPAWARHLCFSNTILPFAGNGAQVSHLLRDRYGIALPDRSKFSVIWPLVGGLSQCWTWCYVQLYKEKWQPLDFLPQYQLLTLYDTAFELALAERTSYRQLDSQSNTLATELLTSLTKNYPSTVALHSRILSCIASSVTILGGYSSSFNMQDATADSRRLSKNKQPLHDTSRMKMMDLWSSYRKTDSHLWQASPMWTKQIADLYMKLDDTGKAYVEVLCFLDAAQMLMGTVYVRHAGVTLRSDAERCISNLFTKVRPSYCGIVGTTVESVTWNDSISNYELSDIVFLGTNRKYAWTGTLLTWHDKDGREKCEYLEFILEMDSFDRDLHIVWCRRHECLSL